MSSKNLGDFEVLKSLNQMKGNHLNFWMTWRTVYWPTHGEGITNAIGDTDSSVMMMMM